MYKLEFSCMNITYTTLLNKNHYGSSVQSFFRLDLWFYKLMDFANINFCKVNGPLVHILDKNKYFVSPIIFKNHKTNMKKFGTELPLMILIH